MSFDSHFWSKKLLLFVENFFTETDVHNLREILKDSWLDVTMDNFSFLLGANMAGA